MCREGIISPDICGIDGLHGLWFVRGSLLRDFAALNKVEIVPHLSGAEMELDWSIWELMNKSDDDLREKEYKLLDTIATYTLNVSENLSAINDCYLTDLSLQVPKAYIKTGMPFSMASLFLCVLQRCAIDRYIQSRYPLCL